MITLPDIDNSELPVLDEVGALRRCSGDVTFMLELLEDFMALYGETATALRSDLQRGEVVHARSKLHAIRGGGSNLGLLQLAVVAGEMEQRLKEDPAADCTAELAALEAAMQRVGALLRVRRQA